MKVNKIISTPVIKNQTVKKGVAGVTALSTAAALFAASKKEGIDSSKIIDEYYRNEFAARNKKQTLRNISRFTPEEQLEFVQREDEIKLFPKAFYRIVNAKNDDNSSRFNADEVLMLFDEAAADIEEHAEIFKTILSVKDDDKFKFNAKECAELMQNVDILEKYPNAFNVVIDANGVYANEVKGIMLSCGEILEENPQFLKAALSVTPMYFNNNTYVKELILKIKQCEIERIRKIEQDNAQKQAAMLSEQQKIQDEKALAEAEKLKLLQARAEKRAALRAIEKQKKEEKMAFLDKQIGWVAPEVIFEKVNIAIENNSPLVLETGEALPDELRDKMAMHIKEHPSKARNLVNARYSNLSPIFNEKECCEMIGDLDSYFYTDRIFALRTVDENAKPFFNPEQCKKLMQVKYDCRDSAINSLRFSRERKANADEIVELMQHNDVTRYCWATFDKLFYSKDENGQHKYSVSECIEKARNGEEA